ncbi:MAG: PQQ-dependent sugar dehydrogenase [Fuerstiella sp.]
MSARIQRAELPRIESLEPLILMSDSAGEGQFEWISGEAVSYTNWAAGQPDNAGGTQDVAILQIDTSTSWEDRADNDVPVFGIIEIGVGETVVPPTSDVLPNGEGFSPEVIASGFVQGISFAEAADGTIFVAEKEGRVKVVQNGQIVGTLIDMTDEVDSIQDRGLLGIAVDPQFDQNGFIYLQYVADLTPGDDSLSTPATGQLIRVTAVPDADNGFVAAEGSRVVIQDGHQMTAATHAIGDVDFDAEGNLLFTWGDGGADERLNNFWVFVSDVPFTSTNLDPVRTDPNVSAFFFSGTAGLSEAVAVNAAGRYVRIQLAGTDDVLSLAEVKVFEI